jgi:hypothetical protein
MSVQISPQPTEEEAVAITAALEFVLRSVAVAATEQSDKPKWRFSGRWWAQPSIARRPRPWT